MKTKHIDSLTKTMESKDNGMMKENECYPGILCPMKISFKNENKIKSAFRQKYNIHYQ